MAAATTTFTEISRAFSGLQALQKTLYSDFTRAVRDRADDRVFFSSRRRHTRSYGDWSSDVCSSDLSRGCKRAGRLEGRGVPEERLVEAPRRKPLAVRTEGQAPHLVGVSRQRVKLSAGSRLRSEERRVGKECRSRWIVTHQKKE